MAAVNYGFDEEDMVIDESVGFPKAYAKLCRDRCGSWAYSHGPPFTFTPHPMQQHEILRAKELDQMFPIIDPKAKPTAKPKIFASLLWKQLNHLGNAGFDPAVIRVDPYGNVLYFHADKASPLAWQIEHWFPLPRGGLTVPSNLRILQWQVCRRKHNKLEFLVPWWDLQLGISVNQFLSIFASSNSDFRRRAFSLLFSEGENEELNDSQIVESHSFPQHFVESKEELGLAPAAVVLSRRESYDSSMALKSLDYNRQIRPQSPAFVAARKPKSIVMKENENACQGIVLARDSLWQRKEAQQTQDEIQKLNEEVNEMKRKNDEEKFAIQDLEMALIKRRRRAEKCRRLAEAQSSYRTMLEKMIRDAMHQSVIYKEQLRLNQVASNALMARLQAQKAICDASEKELHKKFKQRDELEKQIRPEPESARKRTRMDDSLSEDKETKSVLYLPGIGPKTPLHKELREFLEEEQKASEAGLSAIEDTRHEEIEEELKILARKVMRDETDDHRKSVIAFRCEIPMEEERRLQIQFPAIRKQEREEDEESRRQRGKGNVERWLQMLLEKTEEDMEPKNSNGDEKGRTEDIIAMMNETFPTAEAKSSKHPEVLNNENDKAKRAEEIVEVEGDEGIHSRNKGIGSGRSCEGKERTENGKERVLARSESARFLRRIPSSPSLILGVKKGVECLRKKPMVTDDYDDEIDYQPDKDFAARNSFVKSSIKSFKKAVKV